MRLVGPYGWLWLAGVVASGGAAVSLWIGSGRTEGSLRAGYRWLAAAALLWCVGSAGQQVVSGQLSGFAAPLTLADLLPLLAFAPMAAGIVTIAAVPAASGGDAAKNDAGAPVTCDPGGPASRGPVPGGRGLGGGGAGATGPGAGTAGPADAGCGQPGGGRVGGGGAGPGSPGTGPMAVIGTAAGGHGTAVSGRAARSGQGPAGKRFWSRLADCYVLASAFFVISWLAIFGPQYYSTGEDPRTFLIGMLLPLAGILVVSALLPLSAPAGRRTAIPLLALAAVVAGDAFGASLRLAGGHEPGVIEQLFKIVGYLLLAAAPWLTTRPAARESRRAGPGWFPIASIVAALAVAAAAILTIANEAAGRSEVDPVVVFAASGALIAFAARVLGLLRESGQALAAARASGGHVRELADRTSDLVLICDLDGTIGYASPSVAAYGYTAAGIEGRNLAEFVHPEDLPAGRREIRRISLRTGGAAEASAEDSPIAGGDHDASVPGRRLAGGRGPAAPRPDASDHPESAAGQRGGGTGHRNGRDGEDDHEGHAGGGADGGAGARFPCRVRAADRTWRHTECAVSPYKQPGEGVQLLVTARDVSDRIALRQQVTHLAFHDRLTGLPNRAYFEERVADVLGRRPGAATREGQRCHPHEHRLQSCVPPQSRQALQPQTTSPGTPGTPGTTGPSQPLVPHEPHEPQEPHEAHERLQSQRLHQPRAPVSLPAPDDLSGEVTDAGVAAVLLDLDGFTAVNDSAGQSAGDAALSEVAGRLRAVVPAQHTVARWGGDEFAILVEARAGAEEVVDVAERVARCISAEPFGVSGRTITLTASIGVALADDSTAENVMRNADVALARAKTLGGGLIEIFAAHLHADVVRRLELTGDLLRAVSEQRLTVEFQPIVELASSRVTGVEALARWWRGGEPVPPGEFLGIAEESGLIMPVGCWVLREACGQLARWRRSSRDIGVAVNFSHRQIGAPGFAESVLGALADAGLPASALTVEVAEQVLVAHRGEIGRRLAELRRHGVRIAIDGFGTGCASLGNLRELPVDVIKIDPSFVSGVGTDKTLALLTHTIIRLGHDLGLTVVAQGIECPRQLELLREMSCPHGQGCLLARPAAAQAVESMIRSSVAPYGPDLSEQGKAPAPT